MNIETVILAAGQGTRMRSRLPKILHPLAGKPLLSYVIDTARELGTVRIHTVIGHGSEAVRAQFSAADDIAWVVQQEQLGTGHAVSVAMPGVDIGSRVLVLYGDVPMLSLDTLRALLCTPEQQCLSLLTVDLPDPAGYGRIVRDEWGKVLAIVEEKDCNSEQLKIGEVNTGILALAASDLARWLPRLSNENAQGEYYLTDLVAMAVAEGYNIETRQPGCRQEVEGINSRRQLAAMERWYQSQLADKLMVNGVTLADPARIDIRGTLTTGVDVTLDVNLVIEGDVELGSGVSVGPNCILRDCSIGDDTVIHANSIIESTTIAQRALIGPFARLRPGTVVDDNAKIGNFVEVKKSTIGRGSKVNHLSYVGDAELGESVNVGAGTITCNYDGANKHKTTIGDDAFIGSNTALVAPIDIGAGATVGAGSTLARDVDQHELAVARARQRAIQNWQRPQKKK